MPPGWLRVGDESVQKAWSHSFHAWVDDDPHRQGGATSERTATGKFIASEDKEAAGEAVHYLFGALLGGAYGLLAEYRPEVTTGSGTAFGAVSAAFDEIGVPVAGLSGPPTESPAATHIYALASHVVFGSVTEATRRLVRA